MQLPYTILKLDHVDTFFANLKQLQKHDEENYAVSNKKHYTFLKKNKKLITY